MKFKKVSTKQLIHLEKAVQLLQTSQKFGGGKWGTVNAGKECTGAPETYCVNNRI